MFLEHNNRFYEINAINYYDSENGQVVVTYKDFLELEYIGENVFGEPIKQTAGYISSVMLNDQLERKVKLDLHNKNSFIIKAPSEVQYSWEATKYDLYINIQNNVKIVDLGEEKEGEESGHICVYKNYEIKGIGNFAMYGKTDKSILIKSQEELNKLPYSKLEHYKSIDDHIKDIQETYEMLKKDPSELIEKYQELKKQGILGTSFEYYTTGVKEFKVRYFSRSYDTDDRKLFDKFVQEFKEYVSSKDTYMSDDCLRKFFKNYGIDYTKSLKK